MKVTPHEPAAGRLLPGDRSGSPLRVVQRDDELLRRDSVAESVDRVLDRRKAASGDTGLRIGAVLPGGERGGKVAAPDGGADRRGGDGAPPDERRRDATGATPHLQQRSAGPERQEEADAGEGEAAPAWLVDE